MATSADPNFDIQQITKDYYDSEDAFNFYEEIWGGENIHIGLYDEIKLAKVCHERHCALSVESSLGPETDPMPPLAPCDRRAMLMPC